MTELSRRNFLVRTAEAVAAMSLASPGMRSLSARLSAPSLRHADAPAPPGFINLTVHFAGICLFVPSSDGRAIHALMPSVPAGLNVPMHYPIVHYQNSAGTTAPDGAEIRGSTITFPSADAAAYDPTSLTDIGDLWATRRPVLRSPDLWNRQALAAQVVMQGARFLGVGRRGHWRSTEGQQGTGVSKVKHIKLSAVSSWSMTVSSTSGLLDLPQYASPAVSGLASLRPANGRLSIEFRNVIETERPIGYVSPPNEPAMPDHFAMFYQLFGETSGPVIESEGIDPLNQALRDRMKELGNKGVIGMTPYTCMEGGGGY